jgi:hypothetical protein
MAEWDTTYSRISACDCDDQRNYQLRRDERSCHLVHLSCRVRLLERPRQGALSWNDWAHGSYHPSFALVVFLRQTEGPIEFEGLGMKFNGAQVVLWAFCIIVFALCAKLLW